MASMRAPTARSSDVKRLWSQVLRREWVVSVSIVAYLVRSGGYWRFVSLHAGPQNGSQRHLLGPGGQGVGRKDGSPVSLGIVCGVCFVIPRGALLGSGQVFLICTSSFHLESVCMHTCLCVCMCTSVHVCVCVLSHGIHCLAVFNGYIFSQLCIGVCVHVSVFVWPGCESANVLSDGTLRWPCWLVHCDGIGPSRYGGSLTGLTA